jgi:hypothetical protein
VGLQIGLWGSAQVSKAVGAVAIHFKAKQVRHGDGDVEHARQDEQVPPHLTPTARLDHIPGDALQQAERGAFGVSFEAFGGSSEGL